MIKLVIKKEVRDEVIKALKVAFPTSNCAKGIEKYTKELAGLLLDELSRGVSNYHIKKGIYRIPLKRLRDYGGAIGPNKKKIHEWLRENNYELVRTLTRGTRLAKEYSMVKLTDWVKLKIDLSSATPEETFGLRFPKYSKLNDQQITDTYDLLPVDLISLEKYIQSLALNCKSLKSKEYQNLIRAVLIYDCAKHNNGCYPQKKLDPPSIFGRKYYSGISIQNIKKELRAPVLGDCWEYDIRSCVVTWKLGYAQKYLDSKKDGTAAVVDAFLFSYAYVDSKEEIINPIKSSVFINSQLDKANQTFSIQAPYQDYWNNAEFKTLLADRIDFALARYFYRKENGVALAENMKGFAVEVAYVSKPVTGYTAVLRKIIKENPYANEWTFEFDKAGYSGTMDLEIQKGDKFIAWTAIEYKDISRFPARIKAAASALYCEGQRGAFRVVVEGLKVMVRRGNAYLI